MDYKIRLSYLLGDCLFISSHIVVRDILLICGFTFTEKYNFPYSYKLQQHLC